MPGPSKFLDDMSQLMTSAMGVAQGARAEAETAMKGFIDRWLADRDLVTREEYEAVREMAVKAREANAALEARLAVLEAAQAANPASAGSAPAEGAAAPQRRSSRKPAEAP